MWAALAALLAALLVTGGCRPPFDSRYDIVPGPVSTANTVAAASEEATPLTAEEWKAVDHALDTYLQSFQELRAATIAPFVREMRQDRSNKWLSEEQTLDNMSKRAQSVLARVRALDDSLMADLTAALPERTAFIDRLRTRRTIDRALAVTAGHDDEGTGQGFVDLDTELDALLARPAFADRAAGIRAALEPQRAMYRQQLGTAATAVATALLDFPGDRLQLLRESGVPEASIGTYVRGGGKQEAIASAVRKSQAKLNRALKTIDDLNDQTLDAWASALPPDAAELFRSEAVFRRALTDGMTPMVRWYVEVVEVLPEVREGRAARTAAASLALRKAMDECAAATIRYNRAVTTGSDNEAGDKLKIATEKMNAAVQEVTKIADEELKQETRDKLQSLMNATAQDGRAALEDVVGRAQAARLVARAPRNMFRVADSKDGIDHNKSLALQLLLGPMADHSQFDQLASAFGALPRDPVCEELWERYHDRAVALESAQEESLRNYEQQAQQRSREMGETEGAFEKEVAAYIAALMAADQARAQLMNEAITDLAAARGIGADDPRVVLARAQLAITRSAVYWRRFQLPWMLGPLWLAQADVLPMVHQQLPDDPDARAAAIATAAAHATAIEEAALDARVAGFNAVRDFVAFVLRMQREGNDSGISGEEVPSLPAMQALSRRVRDAAGLRIDAQLALIDALEPHLGAERIAKLRYAYARETFPEFFAEHPWYADARAIAESLSGIRVREDSPAVQTARAAEAWRNADAAMVQRLIQWERLPTSVPPPLRAQDLGILALEDGELSSLRATRDENALRLLRDAALAANLPPNARMTSVLRTVSRPTVKLSD